MIAQPARRLLHPSPAPADMVVFLKDGSRLELAGLERFQEIVDYIEAQRRKL